MTFRHALGFGTMLVLSGLPLEAQEDSLARSPEAVSFPVSDPASQGISAEALAALVDEVNGYLERDLIVGGELMVIKNRRTVLHEYFGESDRESETAWGPGTVCNIRSMTKPITAAAAQLLVDRGKLDLDAPVAQYLPGFKTEESGAITVRQLITHRAGLPLTILTSIDEFESLVDMGNAMGERGPEFEPGSRFWYSDIGTDTLGAVVEVAAGMRLGRFVTEELLVPLGMQSSFYFIDDEDPRRSRIASLYAGGMGKWKRFLDPDEGSFYPFAWGSQSVYSTPEDYGRFLAMWMDGGRVGDKQLLSEAAIERTLTPVSEMTMMGSTARFPTSFTGLEVFYGQMSVLHVPKTAVGKGPATILGHSGSDGTIAWAWPKRDLMVLYFTQSRGGGTALRLEETLDRNLIAPQIHASTAVPAELQPFIGTYVADWGTHMKEEFQVEYRAGKFVLDVPSQMRFELARREGEEKWSFAIAPTLSVWFERDGEGEVDCLRIHQGPLTFEAPRKGTLHEKEYYESIRADAKTLAKYFGTYDDPDEDDHAVVRIDGDYLAVDTTAAVFHLWKVPINDTWQVREQPMISVSFQEEDGKVVSLTRHMPGGKTLICKRIE